MAYDRTERFRKLVTQTPPIIGPGSYEIVDLLPKPPRDPECLYPFLTGARRITFKVSKDIASLPGPGNYDPKQPRYHGGVSIDYTEARFKREYRDDSGSKDLESYFEREHVKRRFDRQIQKRSRGKLWLCRPPRPSATTGVSVPSRRDANGYDVNEYGILVKNPPDEREPIAFYDVPRGETCFTTKRYRGNFWSRMTGREERGKNFEIPGPGYYDLEEKPNFWKLKNERMREYRRATSKQPRYLDALYQQKLREGNPAPNQYDPPKGSFDGKVGESGERRSYAHEPVAFGQGAKRFENTQSEENPAPGMYDVVGTGKSCPGSILKTPFGLCASRFKRAIDHNIPGPGQYYTGREGLAYELWKRHERRPVSGSVKSEMAEIEKKESWITNHTCPQVHSVISINGEKKCKVYHAVFKSKIARTLGIVVKDTPAPNAYDIQRTYGICRDQCNFLRKSRTAPFNSSSARFTKALEGANIDAPGIGLYDLRLDISENIKGGVISRAPKLEMHVSTGPGPQKYCLNPFVASSIMRRTFNVTLGKSNTSQATKNRTTSLPHRSHARKKLR